MIEQNLISDKKISKSLTKMQTVSSDKKFRVKSLRIKTNNTEAQQRINQKLRLPSIINKTLKVKTSILQKNFQEQLVKMNFTQDFLYKLYLTKSQEQGVKASEEKYKLFQRGLYYKIVNKVDIKVESFNFRQRALFMFLQWYLQYNTNTIGLDLSNCSSITEVRQNDKTSQNNPIETNQAVTKIWESDIMKRIIFDKKSLVKLNLENTKLNQWQIVDVLDFCLKSKKIYYLNLSNRTSSHLNRFGQNKEVLQYFLQANQSIGVLKLDNLNLKDEGIQKICQGVIKNQFSTLKILSVVNNFISQKSSQEIYALTKSGITQLNLSSNELGPIFFANMQLWRNGTIKILNLSNTSMNSESLINFFRIIQDCKLLHTLILDNNDFSNHWFNKINQKLAENDSIQDLSMSQCNIRAFYPIFQGLTYSKTLKKLNISHNVVNVQDQNLHKVSQCFSLNKTLQKVNIRYSGYKEGMLVSIFQALRQNRALKTLDISENNLSDTGARQIIKLLNQNQKLTNIIIQKLQTSVRVKEQIEHILKHNKKIRQKKQFNKLQKQSTVWKSKQTISWKQVEVLFLQQKKLKYNIQVLQQKNSKVQKKVAQKKQKIQELIKYFGEQQKKIDKQHRTLQRIQNQKVKNLQKLISNHNLTENQLIQNVEIQQKLISNLEQKIKKQNQIIKKRQNELQDLLRDKKYINRKKIRESNQSIDKKDSQAQRSPRLKKQKERQGGLFDNTKSIIKLSKRKNSNNNDKKQK